jgi:hypothetical protein
MATVPAATDQLTVTADSRLSDDYLLASPAQVSGNLQGAVCLAGSQDGTRLCHFAILGGVASELQPSDQSPTGTAAVQLPGGEGASQIAGFVNYDGSVHACYVTGQGLMHAQRDSGGQWTTAEVALTDSAVTALGAAGNVWTGGMVVAGISGEGDLVLLAEDGSAWSASTVAMGGALTGFEVIRLCYTTPTTWALFAASGNGPLQIWEGNADGLQGPKSVTVAADVAGIWFCYSHDESPMAIFSDVNGALYYSTGYADQVTTSVELSGVTSGAGLIGPDSYIHFFATDGDGTLWVMRQTKWHGAKPHWAPLFQLDTGVSFVTATGGAFSAAGAATMALSAVHDQGSIDLLSQPGTAGLWNRAPVQVPGPDQTVAMNRYRTRLTVTDANGLPSPGTQIQVTPSELVALEVAGNSVSCSPDAAAFLTTDVTGCVEFSQVATGLEAVTFTVSGTGIASPLAVTPHDYLHLQLAGSASVFTGSATIPAMSAQTLTSAGPVFTKPVNADQAAAVASACTAIFNVMNGSVPANVTGYKLDLATNPQQPTFQTLTSSGDLAAAMAEQRLAGDIWDDVGNFFGDILHGLEQGALQVASWTINVVEKTISIGIQISATATAVITALAFDTIAAAISVVHNLFGWLGAPVAAVLNWLKDLLPWAEIWTTMETFNGYVIGGLQGLATLIEQKAAISSGHFFADLKDRVDTAIGQVITEMGGQPLRPDRGTPPLSQPYTHQPGWLPGSDATNNWVKSKLFTYLPGASFPLDGGITPAVFEPVIDALQSSGLQTDLMNEWTNVQNYLATLWGNGDDLGDSPASAALKVIQGLIDLVLDGADALVPVLLDLIGEAITALVAILNTPLPEIPLLTWLWDSVLRPADSTERMTLGKLICLAIAAPVTLFTALFTPADAAADPADALAIVRIATSGVLVWIDAGNDCVNATAPETTLITWIVNAIDVVANAIVNMLFWPVGIPLLDWDWGWDDMKLGDQLTNATWLGYWAPIIIDGGIVALEGYALRLGSPLENMYQYANVALDTACGAALIAFGAWGAFEQLNEQPPTADGIDVMEAFLGPLPWMTQPLILKYAVTSSDSMSLLAQAVIDFFGDWDWSDLPG